MKERNFSISSIYSFYLMTILILPLSFLIRLLYSNTISSDFFGLIYAIIAFFGLLSFIASAGLNSSLEFFIGKLRAKNDKKKIAQIVQYNFFLKLFLIMIMSLFVYLLSNFLAKYHFKSDFASEMIIVFLIYFIFLKLYETLKSIFIAHQLNLYYQGARFFELFSVLIFSLLFFLYVENNLFLFYAYSWGIGALISFLIFLALTYFKFPYIFKIEVFDFKLFKEYVSYSFSMFSAGIGKKIINQTDLVVVTFFLSLSSVAYFSNASALVTTLTSSVVLITRPLMPLFAQYDEERNYEPLKLIVSTLYSLVLFFLIPFTLIFALFPTEILSLLFGTEYAQGSLVLIILASFLMFRILMLFNISFLNGLGEAKYLSRVILPIALFNLGGNILLVSIYGIEGVALVSAISWFIIFLLTYLKLNSKISINMSTNYFMKLIICTFSFVFLVYLLKNTVYFYNYYLTGFLVLTFSFVFYILLGYFLRVYTLESLYVFFPKKFKRNFLFYHKKYFSFLK